MHTSEFLSKKILNAVLRGQDFAKTPTTYIALFTTNPTANGNGTEVIGGAYKRKAIKFGEPIQNEDTEYYCSNTDTVEFAVATTDWGTVTHVGIYDAEAGGNLLYFGAVETPKTIEANDCLRYLPNNLKIGQI